MSWNSREGRQYLSQRGAHLLGMTKQSGRGGSLSDLLNSAAIRLGLKQRPPMSNEMGALSLGALGAIPLGIAALNPEGVTDLLSGASDTIANGLHGLGEGQRSNDWYAADADRAEELYTRQKEHGDPRPGA